MYFLRLFQQVYDKSSLFFVKISNANITRQIYTRTHIKTHIYNTYIHEYRYSLVYSEVNNYISIIMKLLMRPYRRNSGQYHGV